MKKQYAVGLTLVVAACTWLASAHAGQKGTYLLSVDTAKRTVKGSIGSIRNATTNSNSYLGVSFAQIAGVGDAPSFAEHPTLFFRPSGGSNTYVSIEDANLIKIAHTITTDSYIEASWDANFICQSLNVEHSSPIAPKVF